MGNLCVLRIIDDERTVALTRMQHQLDTAEGLVMGSREYSLCNRMANNKSGSGPWTMVSEWSDSATADSCDFGRRTGWIELSHQPFDYDAKPSLVALPRPFVTAVVGLAGGICNIEKQNTPWRTEDETALYSNENF